ncbi:MAG: hypothetical protein ACNI27_06060 [Desulfovibrio sp.]
MQELDAIMEEINKFVAIMHDSFGVDGTTYLLMGFGMCVWFGASFWMMKSYRVRLLKRIAEAKKRK